MSEEQPTKKARTTKEKKPKGEGGKRGSGGFDKEYSLSAKLSSFMGSPTGARSAIIKQLWVSFLLHEILSRAGV
jgi:chromatin remodeling complex protein RSC6